MRRAALGIALALAASGCGSTAGAPAMDVMLQTPRPVETATVRIAGFDYGPRTLHIRAGTRVVWRNEDISNHTVTFRSVNAPRSINDLQVGSRTSRIFRHSGRYRYVCVVHPGMRGVVVVGRTGAG